MTNDETRFDNSWPVEEQAAYWLRVLTDEPTPESYVAFDRWVATSPAHVTEFTQAQDLDDHLREFIRNRAIDVDALVERAKQEQRAIRRLIWGKRIGIVCGLVAMWLLVRFIL